MNDFRAYLQQEFVRRTAKNPSYSLRSFALQLKINHATLSSLLSGKRKMTEATALKLAQALSFSPGQISEMVYGQKNDHRKSTEEAQYFLLQQDTFAVMSEWYFDAVLEMVLIPHFILEPSVISKALGVTTVQAKIALQTLERLQLIEMSKKGRYQLRHQNSDNCLDADYTSAANRKYQKSILEKSMEALEIVDRKRRDHTSTTLAIDTKDIPKVKELIQKFRRDLDSYVHRPKARLNEVYQLQVSFFPLSNQEN